MWFIDVIGDKTSIDKGNLLSSVVWNLVPVYHGDGRGSEGRQVRHQGLFDPALPTIRCSCCRPSTSRTMSGPRSPRLRKQIVDGSLKIEPVWEAQKVRALMSLGRPTRRRSKRSASGL